MAPRNCWLNQIGETTTKIEGMNGPKRYSINPAYRPISKKVNQYKPILCGKKA